MKFYYSIIKSHYFKVKKIIKLFISYLKIIYLYKKCVRFIHQKVNLPRSNRRVSMLIVSLYRFK